MKKMIAIIVAVIFVFAMAAVSLAAEEKTEIKEQTKQEEFKGQENLQWKELTPEEEEKQLKEFEEQEKKLYKNVTPEEMDWGDPEEKAK